MSLLAMSAVWQHFPRGGSEKLTLLALADWCDDDGKTLFPSIQRIAKKICASESQARRIMHGFIEEGLLSVVGNHNGGAKGATRQYHLHYEKLTATPSTHATPSADATPSMDARDGCHPCASGVAPMTPNTSLTVINPPKGAPHSKKEGEKKSEVNSAEKLVSFLERCKQEGVKAIPEDDSIFKYADMVGLTEQMMAIAWFCFKQRFLQNGTQQKDWRAHFRNAVRGNWFKVWYIAGDGATSMTTVGQQAAREMAAMAGGKA